MREELDLIEYLEALMLERYQDRQEQREQEQRRQEHDRDHEPAPGEALSF